MFRRALISVSRPLFTVPARYASSTSWSHVVMGPKDPILGVSEAFKEDKDPRKLNLGVGAYRDDNNKPVIIKSVAEATKRLLAANANNEYAPIAGDPAFVKLGYSLALGEDAAPIKENRIAAIQALSGTGALRIAAAFLARFYQGNKTLYVPNPTWGNHMPIALDGGLQWKYYSYYKPETKGLHLAGLLADVEPAPASSIFLFHACAHNPTGVDPKQAQWKQISNLVKQKGHFVIVDSAYQGFASGDPTADSFAVRQFVNDGHQVAICQSFSKNFGLYGQRVGVLSLITANQEETARVESQLKILARPMYSNPPIHGSRIVSTILADPALRKQWYADVKEMAERIILMRVLLKKELEKIGSTLNWSHITDQIGMFCFSGLSPAQVDRLTNEFHIYLTRNGRISMAGVTTKDIPYLANAIHQVSK